MPAPIPPTEAEREARARFVEAKNDVALLIECLNRGLAFGPGESADGFAEMLADLAEQAPTLGKAAARLRHNLPERADVELPSVSGTGGFLFLVWPDGEVYDPSIELAYGFQRMHAFQRRARISRSRFPELRLYDAREKTFIDPEEEP